MTLNFSDDNQKQVIISNISGVPVYNKQTQDKFILIGLQDLPDGLYIAIVILNGKVSSRKIMIL
jgi:hypothetical protein